MNLNSNDNLDKKEILERGIIKTNTVNNIVFLTEKLIKLNYNVILVLDIDDTVLSSKIGKKFVEKDICNLINIVYTINPANLIFLTARHPKLKSYTKNKLNSAKILHEGNYIDFNILCSPDDDNGIPTKGQTFFNYFNNGFGNLLLQNNNKENWLTFVDDLFEQIDSVNQFVGLIFKNYTLFHYVYKETL